ncbi:MAG: hypothetical protein R3D33_10980 [Hyphomicrobiaceae bacterium]
MPELSGPAVGAGFGEPTLSDPDTAPLADPAAGSGAWPPAGTGSGAVAAFPATGFSGTPAFGAADGGDLASSPLPRAPWSGLPVDRLERLIASLPVPTASPALAALWMRLLTTDASPPDGGAPGYFDAVRLEALRRSGFVEEAGRLSASLGDMTGAGNDDPLVLVTASRAAIAAGDAGRGCAGARRIPLKGDALRGPMRSEALLMVAWCLALKKNPETAGLAADLLRDQKVDAPIAIAALDAMATGGKPAIDGVGRAGLMDMKLLALAGVPLPGSAIEGATPELLAVLALDDSAALDLRIAAAEGAAVANAIAPARLATLYARAEFAGTIRQAPTAADLPPPLKRALLYQAAAGERQPVRKARLVRALLDEARGSGLYLVVARMLADPIADMPQISDIAWFSETAVEIDIAAGRYREALRWIDYGNTADPQRQGGLVHWYTLIDIANPDPAAPRGSSMRFAEQMAVRGGFPAELLQRLATVLDALQFNIPIPLWEAASRTPQNEKGFLPPTGVLPDLQTAAVQRDVARTVLLAIAALGPEGAAGANQIALGDTIRALQGAGLEIEARRLGFEALFLDWPRRTSG